MDYNFDQIKLQPFISMIVQLYKFLIINVIVGIYFTDHYFYLAKNNSANGFSKQHNINSAQYFEYGQKM